MQILYFSKFLLFLFFFEVILVVKHCWGKQPQKFYLKKESLDCKRNSVFSAPDGHLAPIRAAQ